MPIMVTQSSKGNINPKPPKVYFTTVNKKKLLQWVNDDKIRNPLLCFLFWFKSSIPSTHGHFPLRSTILCFLTSHTTTFIPPVIFLTPDTLRLHLSLQLSLTLKDWLQHKHQVTRRTDQSWQQSVCCGNTSVSVTVAITSQSMNI